MQYWPIIVKEMVDIVQKYSYEDTISYIVKVILTPNAKTEVVKLCYLPQMLNYTVGEGGKKHRIKIAVQTYKSLNPKGATEENLKLATILGWGAEMVKWILVFVE